VSASIEVWVASSFLLRIFHWCDGKLLVARLRYYYPCGAFAGRSHYIIALEDAGMASQRNNLAVVAIIGGAAKHHDAHSPSSSLDNSVERIKTINRDHAHAHHIDTIVLCPKIASQVRTLSANVNNCCLRSICFRWLGNRWLGILNKVFVSFHERLDVKHWHRCLNNVLVNFERYVSNFSTWIWVESQSVLQPS
jgi:hypothetical protein